MTRTIISTNLAPRAIGPYSQAICCADTLYISGQLPLDPDSMVITEGIEQQIPRVFANLSQILVAANMRFEDIAKITIYLTDLNNFSLVNETMLSLFSHPFPARATIGVASLPLGALVEVEAIAVKNITTANQ